MVEKLGALTNNSTMNYNQYYQQYPYGQNIQPTLIPPSYQPQQATVTRKTVQMF
jgi:hypothetical protein